MNQSSSSKWRKRQNISCTERDLQFLYALSGIKYMSTTQICALFWLEFSSSPLLALKSCQRRLRQLEASGVIRRIPQATKRGEGSKPDLFKLAANSLPLLEYELGVDPTSVDIEVWADEELNPKIKHILATTDVHISFSHASKTCGFTLEEWIDESALRSSPTKDTITTKNTDGEERQVSLIPDAFFVLSINSINSKRGIYRLEVDRASIELEASREQKRSIAQKIRRYILLEQSESYRTRYGTRPLQVLWTVKGERRKTNMMNVAGKVIKHFVQLPTEEPKDENQNQEYEKKLAECKRLNRRFLFTTLDEIERHNPITEPIWHIVGSEAPRKLIE